MKIFVCPEIEKIIFDHCAKTKRRKDFTSHYLYVVSNIFIRPYTDKRIEDEDYVPINMELLRTLVSEQESKLIIDNLLKIKVLETDGIAVPGKKSKGYKIKNKHSYKWRLVTLNDLKLAKKLTCKNEIRKNDVNIHGKGYQVVNHWFGLLELDVKKAKKYISNHYRADQDKYNSAFYSINLFTHEMKFILVDSTSYRLHNNLTNIDAKLRKFLIINGEGLAQVDIRNSQPLFLGMMLKDYKMVDSEELKIYLKLVCSGQFYEYLAEKMPEKKLNLKNDLIRKKFKKSIFSGVLFDENRCKLSKYEMLFQKEFPTIFTSIRNIKSVEYNALAIMLQKMESTFIFNAVALIDSEMGRGKIPLLTIHDSIVSTVENIYRVKQIMERLFFNVHSLTPELEVSQFK